MEHHEPTSQPITLPYRTPQRWSRKRWWRIGAVLLIVMVVLWWATHVCFYDTLIEVDYVTGSTRTVTSIPTISFKISSNNVSPLEARLVGWGIPWKPDWHLRNHIRHGIFWTSRACNTQRIVSQLGVVLQGYAMVATQEELREFVRIMESGTDAEKEAALESASARYFRAVEEGKAK